MAYTYKDHIRHALNLRYWGDFQGLYKLHTTQGPNSYYGDGSKSASFTVDISKDIIELPIYGCTHVLDAIMYKYRNPPYYYNKVVLPLFSVQERHAKFRNHYATCAPAIKIWFTDAYLKHGLVPITIKDTLYYGNKGIILDKDFNILIMICISIEEASGSTPSCPSYDVLRPILYIDRSVFQKEDIMSRHIRQKMLGEVMSWGDSIRDATDFTHYVLFRSARLTSRFKVVIDDLSKLINVPSVPSANTTSSTINDWLAETFTIPSDELPCR